MKLLLPLAGLIAVLGLSGCNTFDESQVDRVKVAGADMKVVRIDGCEYYANAQPDSNSFALTHKGNCDNPIHPYNKIVESKKVIPWNEK